MPVTPSRVLCRVLMAMGHHISSRMRPCQGQSRLKTLWRPSERPMSWNFSSQWIAPLMRFLSQPPRCLLGSPTPGFPSCHVVWGLCCWRVGLFMPSSLSGQLVSSLLPFLNQKKKKKNEESKQLQILTAFIQFSSFHALSVLLSPAVVSSAECFGDNQILMHQTGKNTLKEISVIPAPNPSR